jgi:hypothetical protein
MSTRIPIGAQAYIQSATSTGQVDATMAHRRAEIVVPVGAVDGMTAVGEVHHVRHVRTL